MMDSFDHQPRISLLLPTKNRKESFERVLAAVLQDKKEYPHLEIIIVDGESADGTTDVIRSHAPEIAWWISKHDRGVYGALNTALAHATGDYVRMIADDDEYVTGQLPFFADYMRTHPEPIAIGGTASYVHVADNGRETPSTIGTFSGDITQETYLRQDSLVLCVHEALFFRRDALVAAGGWDPRFIVSADLNLIFRLLSKGGRFTILPRTILHTKRHSQSLSVRHALRGRLEVLFILVRLHQWRLLFKTVKRLFGLV